MKNNETSMEIKDKIIYIKNAKAGDKIKIEVVPARAGAARLVKMSTNDESILQEVQEMQDDSEELFNVLSLFENPNTTHMKIQIGFDQNDIFANPQIKLFRDDEELLQESLDYKSINKKNLLIQRNYDDYFPDNQTNEFKENFDVNVIYVEDIENVDFVFTLLNIEEDGDLQINLGDFCLLSGYLKENIIDGNLIRKAIYISQKEKEELFNRLKDDFKEKYEDYKKEYKDSSVSLFGFLDYINDYFVFAKYGASENFKKYFSNYECELEYDGNIDMSIGKAMIKIGYKDTDGKFKLKSYKEFPWY